MAWHSQSARCFDIQARVAHHVGVMSGVAETVPIDLSAVQARRAQTLPLSVALVCRNNVDTIERTLSSVASLAREIVAVDSGSTDGTIEILEQHGARIIRSTWLGHIKTKQLALEACAQEWVLSIDSDESVEPELASSIREAIGRSEAVPVSVGQASQAATTGRTSGYEVNRKVYYNGHPLNHAWQPEWRLRLVRRDCFRWAGLDPHDFLEAIPSAGEGGTARIRGTLRHDSISTFGEFFVKQAAHARTMARSLHSAGKRGSLAKLLVSPASAFLKQIILKQAWRDGYAGWLAAASAAVGAIIKHAVLIELSAELETAPTKPNEPGTN